MSCCVSVAACEGCLPGERLGGLEPDPEEVERPEDEQGEQEEDPDQPGAELACEAAGVPCGFDEASDEATERSVMLLGASLQRLRQGESMAEIAGWLQGQDGVASVRHDELTVTLQVDGAPPVFLTGSPLPGQPSTLEGAPTRPAGLTRAQPLSADEHAEVLGREGQGAGVRRALILDPFNWQFSPWGSVAEDALLRVRVDPHDAGTRRNYLFDYRADAAAGIPAFSDFQGYDFIFIQTHGVATTIGEGEGEHEIVVLTTGDQVPGLLEPEQLEETDWLGLLDAGETPWDEEARQEFREAHKGDGISISCGNYRGFEAPSGEEGEIGITEGTASCNYVLTSDYFESRASTRDLEDTVFIVHACQTAMHDALWEVLLGDGSLYYSYTETVDAHPDTGDAFRLTEDLLEETFSATPQPVTRAFDGLEETSFTDFTEYGGVEDLEVEFVQRPEARTPDLFLVEPTRLYHPQSGKMWRPGPVQIEGEVGDDEDDQLVMRARVTLPAEPDGGEVIPVWFYVDGVAVGIDQLLNSIDGTSRKIAERTYELELTVELGFPVTRQTPEVTLRAEVELPGGHLSVDTVTGVELAGDALLISPKEVCLEPDQAQQFEAFVLREEGLDEDPGVDWDVSGGGMIDASGAFAPSGELGIFDVEASTQEMPTLEASAKVRVSEDCSCGPTVCVSCPCAWGAELTGSLEGTPTSLGGERVTFMFTEMQGWVVSGTDGAAATRQFQATPTGEGRGGGEDFEPLMEGQPTPVRLSLMRLAEPGDFTSAEQWGAKSEETWPEMTITSLGEDSVEGDIQGYVYRPEQGSSPRFVCLRFRADVIDPSSGGDGFGGACGGF